ncbi:carboxylic ester hydrolase [Halyomorpha halys]|uniref:carboxylic ester hydrolase n=1 Tax=Halyomorpha halys TaxID=286706 RepID=UPI0006D4FF65|nr:venom carboxylesterase-6-like [Halyomorpha halys]
MLLLFVALQAAGASPLIVSAPSGHYRGYELTSNSGRPFQAFSGIRYALPPVGHFRFQEPLALHDTDEILDALEEGPPCLQIDSLDSSDQVIGDEDCLYLNVYTPGVSNGTYPVLFWIHGGSWKFGSGSSSMYGPGALLDKDVVLVTINYRLGPLGFSSLEDDTHPGNLGLKDQLAALHWTHRNIHAFGGDPDRITAAGQSAGAASVYFLMNAPAAQGLLVGGIAQSGSWLSPWAVGTPGSIREKTLKLAQLADCKGKTSAAVISCLLDVPGKKLVEAVKSFGLLEQELLPFRPVIEPKGGIIVEDPWITVPTPLPVLTGFTSAEGAFVAVILSQGGGLLITVLDQAFDRFAPDMLMYAGTASSPSTITHAIRDFYLGESNITGQNLGPVIDMVSDAWIIFPVHEAALRQTGPVYGYMFDHKGATDVVHVLGSKQDFGVSHGDDIPYLFNTEKLNIQTIGNEADKNTSQHLVEIWANFATTGRPFMEGLEWYPLDDGGYMVISGNFSQGPVLSDRIDFWSSLPYRDKLKPKHGDYVPDYSTENFEIL